ncbi:hypothetical protein J1614_009530 [Plenodomus biglobosus]|nr:hypothetical protein J1614_009530 [Plenodomus biglobosus]
MSWSGLPSTAPCDLTQPIPQGPSSPAHPEATSFLTLPPEIRNAIYDELLGPAREIEVYAHDSAWHPVIDPAFSARARAGLVLLSTCRQIYHELATAIFANNSWTVYRDPRSFSSDLDQADSAAGFLNSIGSHMSMLRKLRIPLWSACATGCKIHWDSSDGVRFKGMQGPVKLSALIRQLWKAPAIARAVEFTSSQVVAQESFHPESARNKPHPDLNVAILNNVVQRLADDSLDLKRYKQQLCEIAVTRDGREGSAHFCVDWLGASGRSFERRFDISNQGTTLVWKPVVVSQLLDFPMTVSNQIFAHVVPPRDYGTSCTARNIVQGPSLVLASVCRELRFRYHNYF